MSKTIVFKVKAEGSREKLRRAVVEEFLKEAPGTGGGDLASKYRYNVEKLTDDSWVYLTRPAYLKKGFDFRINVENHTFSTGGNFPKHDDIFGDLRSKKRENSSEYRRLHEAMTRVFRCEEPNDFFEEYSNLNLPGYKIEMILKVIKWLLIEQDIRDWNYSGRNMFYLGLKEILHDEPSK